MFIDFDTDELFGNGDLKLAKSKSCQLKANNPNMVKEYIGAMHEYLDDQDFWPLHKSLMKSKQLEPDKIEKADKILLDASIYAEKQCKFRPRSWWSLPLAKAKVKLNTLKTHLSQLRCGIEPNSRKMKYGITINCPQTLAETQAELFKTQRDIKNIICKSKEKRRESNETLAEIHSITGNTTTAKALKSIMKAEKMQQ
eukprot:14902477-Ditylum_brightwellii.AAC.1